MQEGNEVHRVAVACHVRGKLFNAPSGYDLGPLCIKCGSADAPHSKTVKVTRAPFWLWFVMISVCPWILLYFIFRKVSRHPVMLCGPCRGRWRLSYLWQTLLTLALIVGVVPLLVMLNLSDVVAGSILLGTILVAVVVPPAIFSRARITALGIADGYADLIGVSPAYIGALGVPNED